MHFEGLRAHVVHSPKHSTRCNILHVCAECCNQDVWKGQGKVVSLSLESLMNYKLCSSNPTIQFITPLRVNPRFATVFAA